MPVMTYFNERCATCGRTLQIQLQYLGRMVACSHCGAKFVPHDASIGRVGTRRQREWTTLDRAEELLSRDGSSTGSNRPRSRDSGGVIDVARRS